MSYQINYNFWSLKTVDIIRFVVNVCVKLIRMIWISAHTSTTNYLIYTAVRTRKNVGRFDN